jgi:hypothetical protein
VGFKVAVPMKMRIAGRARPVQGEKGMFVYRRDNLKPIDSMDYKPSQPTPKPRIITCQSERSGVIPSSISPERYLFRKVYQLAKRRPEPTKMEAIELLVPCRLED